MTDPDYVIHLFIYTGVTDVDWATPPFSNALYVCAEIMPALPGVEVTFHIPTNPAGGPPYGDFVQTALTGIGTGYAGLAAIGWNGATGPNYSTLTYAFTATTPYGTSNEIEVTWHHAPDVGFPDYITPPPVLSATVAPDNTVTLSWAPDSSVNAADRRIAWKLEQAAFPSGPWTDISNADPAAIFKIVGPITTTTYYRVDQFEVIPGLEIYSPVLAVTPGSAAPPPVASWGVLAR